MSWLSKVSDLAGKAEEMLVRMDQNAGSAITQAKQQAKSSSTASLNRPLHEPTITEEIGRSGQSHAHSDFIKPQKKKQPTAGYAPSTSVLPEHRDANLISFLNDPDVEEMEMGKSTYSVHSVTEATDLVLLNNLRSQLAAKDTQMEILKNTNNKLEKRLEEEKLKLKKSEEKVKESTQPLLPATPSVSNESLIKERNTLQSELSNLKKRVASQEEQLSAVNDQLRLAKFNLTENKKEFDAYKEKAQKILQTKEKLIESLKSESGTEEKSNGVLLAQIEEMKLERDLARSDLESAQVMVYNMRGEVDEAESAAREARNALSEMKKRTSDESHSHQVNLTLWKEKAECARSEVEVIRVEREMERSEWQRKMDEKEAELIGLRDEVRRKRSFQAAPEDGGRSTMILLQKEEELREANREKQILRVRLERMEKQSKDTVVQMGESNQSIGGGGQGMQGQSHNFLQSIMMKGLATLRGSSTARSYFAGYLLTIHLLLFFIIITYTPESHGADSPSNPTHDHG